MPAPGGAEEVVAGHLHVVEGERHSGRGAHAELVLLGTHVEPWGLPRDAQQGERALAAEVRGANEEGVEPAKPPLVT
jgi:hypothetical protein